MTGERWQEPGEEAARLELVREEAEDASKVWRELKRQLECLLFVACEPLSLAQLKEITGRETALIRRVVAELSQEFAGRGFVLRQIAGGYQFFSAADLNPYVERLYRPKMQQLSRAGLETLAIIAYKQPLTRLDMENIRQVKVDGVVNTLLEKGLIQEVGRREGPGRPILYGTTAEFLSFFGLNSLKELPELASFLPEEGREPEIPPLSQMLAAETEEEKQE